MLCLQIHAGPCLLDIQRAVDDRPVRGVRQRNPLLDGDLLGGVFRRRIRYSNVVGRLSLKIYGLLRKTSIHTKADLYNR